MVVLAGLLLTAAVGYSEGSAGAITTVATVARLKPPVIHETFTQLPCPAHPRTTLAMEGCIEKAILRSDERIDGQAKSIFGVLLPAAREQFVQSEGIWLRYRRAFCLTEASRYAGGTFHPLAFATCVAARNRTHLSDLAELKRVLTFH